MKIQILIKINGSESQEVIQFWNDNSKFTILVFFLKIEFLDIIRDFVTMCEFYNLLVHLMGNVQIAWDNKMKYVPHVSKEFVIH